jgi:hypothetical protein
MKSNSRKTSPLTLTGALLASAALLTGNALPAGNGLLAPTAQAQVADGSALVRAKGVNGKYGFKDAAGVFVVPAAYDMVWAFHEGRALVRLGGKFGFVDAAGTEIVSPRYDGAKFFSDGLAAVNIGGVYDAETNRVGAGRWGYVDRDGRLAIATEFDGAGPFANGTAVVVTGERKIRINRLGRRVAKLGRAERAPVVVTLEPTDDPETVAVAVAPAQVTPTPTGGAAIGDNTDAQFLKPVSIRRVDDRALNDRPRSRGFVEAAFGGYVGKSTDFLGFEIAGGLYLTKNDKLKLNVGFYFDVNSESIPGTNFPYWEYDYYDDYYGSGSGGHWCYDGKIKMEYTFIPIVLSWEHEFRLTKNWSFRLGPAVGIGILHSSIERDPFVENSHHHYRVQNKFASQTKSNLMLGATGGFTWYWTRDAVTGFFSIDASAFWVANRYHFDYGEVELPTGDAGVRPHQIGSRTVDLIGGKIALVVGLKF